MHGAAYERPMRSPIVLTMSCKLVIFLHLLGPTGID